MTTPNKPAPNSAPQHPVSPRTPLTCKERMPEPGDVIKPHPASPPLVVDGYNNEHAWIECHHVGKRAEKRITYIEFCKEHGVYVSRADGGPVTQGSKKP